jgi:YVTN family beta-propeller protein
MVLLSNKSANENDEGVYSKMRNSKLYAGLLCLSLVLANGCTGAKVTDSDFFIPKPNKTPEPKPILTPRPQTSASPQASANPGSSTSTSPSASPSTAPSTNPTESGQKEIRVAAELQTKLSQALELKSEPLALNGEVLSADGKVLEQAVWTVSDSSIAEIKEGKLSPLKDGQITLKAASSKDPDLWRVFFIRIGIPEVPLTDATPASGSYSGAQYESLISKMGEISSYGKYLFVPDQTKNQINILDTSTGKITKKIDVSPNPQATEINPNGTRLYVGSKTSNNVDVIDLNSMEKIETISVASPVFDLEVDNTQLYVSYEGNNEAQEIYDLTSKIKTASLPTTTKGKAYLQLSADNFLYVGNTTYSVVLYKVALGGTPTVALTSEVNKLGYTLKDMAISPDGTRLYLMSNISNTYVQVVDTSDFKAKGSLESGGYYPYHLDISPDGKYVAVTGYIYLFVYETATQKEVHKQRFGRIANQAVFAADGKSVAGTFDRSNLGEQLLKFTDVSSFSNP